MSSLVSGIYKPIHALMTNTTLPNSKVIFLSTVVKIGVAVGTYFAFGAVMALMPKPWMALGVGVALYQGLQTLTNGDSIDAGVGCWLIVQGVNQVAKQSLWYVTALGAAKIASGLYLFYSADGQPRTAPNQLPVVDAGKLIQGLADRIKAVMPKNPLF